MENRIYTNQPLFEGANITLEGDIAHYIRNVLRMQINANLCVFNASHGEFVSNITVLGKKEITLRVEKLLRKPFSSPKLTIATCIIKNDKMADMVNMLTQLGATEIIPIISDYTTHRNFKQDRFERVVIEASEQSERLDVPAVLKPIALAEFLKGSRFEHIIYAYEREDVSIKLSREIVCKENIALIVGPEGGFSDKEVAMLREKGAISVSLGQNILRAETAAVKLASYVQFLRESEKMESSRT